MKSKIKALLISVCVIAVLAASAVGAMAYFTDTDKATNTFTVGSVRIKLNEADVSTSDLNDRTDKGNAYHLLPGHSYVKDPTVYVIKGSSEAYIRMLVEVENYTKLKNAFPAHKSYEINDEDVTLYDANGIVLIQHLVEGWDSAKWEPVGVTVDEKNDIATYEFRYFETVDASKAEADVALEPLFTKIVVPAEVDNKELAWLNQVEINVYAHAVQAGGFEKPDDAWKAFDIQNPAVSKNPVIAPKTGKS